MNNKEDEAASLLAHYLKTVWLAAGLKWDSDNEAEVRDIVSMIVEAA